MTKGLSIRAYSRHRGVSDTAVRKAIQSGRITQGSDGLIDPIQADAQWSVNTDVAQQRKAAPQESAMRAVPQEAVQSVRETLAGAQSAFVGVGGGGGSSGIAGGTASGPTTLLQAKTANEVLKAQTNKLRLAQLKGELIHRDQALAHVFRMARAERDAWLNWPARVAAQMASEVGVDSHALHVLLEQSVREQLTSLGDLALRLE
jgi:hypothetical protein